MFSLCLKPRLASVLTFFFSCCIMLVWTFTSWFGSRQVKTILLVSLQWSKQLYVYLHRRHVCYWVCSLRSWSFLLGHLLWWLMTFPSASPAPSSTNKCSIKPRCWTLFNMKLQQIIIVKLTFTVSPIISVPVVLLWIRPLYHSLGDASEYTVEPSVPRMVQVQNRSLWGCSASSPQTTV